MIIMVDFFVAKKKFSFNLYYVCIMDDTFIYIVFFLTYEYTYFIDVNRLLVFDLGK